MARAMNLRHRRRCATQTDDQLLALLRTTEPEVRRLQSLIECARNELARRHRPIENTAADAPGERSEVNH